MPEYSVVGVDLAGVLHRPTGMCLLKNMDADTMLVYADESILGIIDEEKPNLVTIDAPLTLPPGRKSIHQNNSISALVIWSSGEEKFVSFRSRSDR